MHCIIGIIAVAPSAEVSEPLITPLLYEAAATEVGNGVSKELSKSLHPAVLSLMSVGDHLHLLLVSYLNQAPHRRLCSLVGILTGFGFADHMNDVAARGWRTTFDVANCRSMEARG